MVGLLFCYHRTLPISRKEVKTLIESEGGTVLPSVGKKVNYVICGENPGSKKEKADQLSIKTLNWSDFQKL